jgi:phosphohistidine phosphatase
MRLFIMRHGPAESTQEGGRDFDRALSPEGRTRVRANAVSLRSRGEAPKRIYSSPLVRTRQTAEIVAEVFGRVDIVLREELAPSENSLFLVNEVRASDVPAVLFVSHAPDVSDLVTSLTGEYMASFDAGMIVAVDLVATGAVSLYTVR